MSRHLRKPWKRTVFPPGRRGRSTGISGKRFRTFPATVVPNDETTVRMDGNNVDIDYENAELAKNTIYYNTLVEQISSELRRLDIAINEGK